jgi:hypothetical protein
MLGPIVGASDKTGKGPEMLMVVFLLYFSRKRQARLDRRGFRKADALSDDVSFDSDPESEDDGDGSMSESHDRSRDVRRNMDYSQAGTYRRPESEGPLLHRSPHPPHSTVAESYGRRTPLGFHQAKSATICGPNAPQNQVSYPQRRYAPRLADLDSPSGRCVRLGARFS